MTPDDHLAHLHAVTMTSLELVEFINSQRGEGEAELQHKHFCEKVSKVLGVETSAKLLADLPDSYGRPRKGYRFPKREACLMAMSYSYDLQAVYPLTECGIKGLFHGTLMAQCRQKSGSYPQQAARSEPA